MTQSILSGDTVLMRIQARAERCARIERNRSREPIYLEQARADLRDAIDTAQRMGYNTLSVLEAVKSAQFMLR